MRYVLISAVLSAACVSETNGERVQVTWVVEQGVPGDFETKTGYHVQLEEARLELEAVYLYAPPRARVSALAWLERSLVSVAHAHGGIDNEKGRRVLAEWTQSISVDALDDNPVELSETSGEAGMVDAVKLRLNDGVVAQVRGRAEREGRRWRFEAEIAASEQVARTVELIELEHSLRDGSVVHIGVQPQAWLDLCEFSRLGEGSDEADPEPVRVEADDQVGRALSIGVRSPNAFSVYVEGED
jgi:hypothetical protein